MPSSKTPAEALAPWIEKARRVIASTGSTDEAVGTLVLDVLKSDNSAAIATLALIQLAMTEAK